MLKKTLRTFTTQKRTFSTQTVSLGTNHNSQERLLITGSKGQVGPLFVRAIANEFGKDNVIASDIDSREVDFGGAKSMVLDVCDT